MIDYYAKLTRWLYFCGEVAFFKNIISRYQ